MELALYLSNITCPNGYYPPSTYGTLSHGPVHVSYLCPLANGIGYNFESHYTRVHVGDQGSVTSTCYVIRVTNRP